VANGSADGEFCRDVVTAAAPITPTDATTTDRDRKRCRRPRRSTTHHAVAHHRSATF
jgi:hypothetical protein